MSKLSLLFDVAFGLVRFGVPRLRSFWFCTSNWRIMSCIFSTSAALSIFRALSLSCSLYETFNLIMWQMLCNKAYVACDTRLLDSAFRASIIRKRKR